MSERYILDLSTSEYLDRERLLQGLSSDFAHERLIRHHANDGIFVGKKKVNPFALYAASQLRTDVARADMFPGKEPAAILRFSPIYGLLKEEETQPDEYKVLNTYRGFVIKPIGVIDEMLMSKVVTALDRMLGLLTRDNDLQMDWLKRFVAWTIQHPEIKQQVAPVIIGGQGIGKSLFGNTLMRSLFGELAGQANAAALDDNTFLITPFINKLVVFVDEVRMESAGSINEIKKLVRETVISGEVKFKDQKDYRIYARLVMAANQPDIGLSPEDAADRALFFIMAWTAEVEEAHGPRVPRMDGVAQALFQRFRRHAGLGRGAPASDALFHGDRMHARGPRGSHPLLAQRRQRGAGHDAEGARGRSLDCRRRPHSRWLRHHRMVQLLQSA